MVHTDHFRGVGAVVRITVGDSFDPSSIPDVRFFFAYVSKQCLNFVVIITQAEAASGAAAPGVCLHAQA